MAYTNSPLVDYTNISPNKTVNRYNTIKKITIHHMAGNLSVEACGRHFASPKTGASSNYGIDSNGRVGMYVQEKDRAWTSSNGNNDHQAVTIEVANDRGDPDWHVSDKAMNKLIELCVDICKRNGINKLIFTGDARGNLTMHSYFIATACPGPYLKSKFKYIADTVNKRLQGNVDAPKTTPVKESKSSFLPSRGYFKRGDNSLNVAKIASFMRKTFPSYTPKEALGSIYGPNLEKSIKEFQKRTGLEPDGFLGPKTLEKLKKYGFKE